MSGWPGIELTEAVDQEEGPDAASASLLRWQLRRPSEGSNGLESTRTASPMKRRASVEEKHDMRQRVTQAAAMPQELEDMMRVAGLFQDSGLSIAIHDALEVASRGGSVGVSPGDFKRSSEKADSDLPGEPRLVSEQSSPGSLAGMGWRSEKLASLRAELASAEAEAKMVEAHVRQLDAEAERLRNGLRNARGNDYQRDELSRQLAQEASERTRVMRDLVTLSSLSPRGIRPDDAPLAHSPDDDVEEMFCIATLPPEQRSRELQRLRRDVVWLERMVRNLIPRAAESHVASSRRTSPRHSESNHKAMESTLEAGGSLTSSPSVLQSSAAATLDPAALALTGSEPVASTSMRSSEGFRTPPSLGMPAGAQTALQQMASIGFTMPAAGAQ
eukprot:TRINITY_DN28657_c0_g1_i1.p1 TRINITY_DN28657_c0_g1~~TRINITY_DN28657_c0_g1_i1.p1  ORF type:complete len:388 (-),score=93.69 TRINITY_DN28657_c0_g1_i1:212-1375(-)